MSRVFVFIRGVMRVSGVIASAVFWVFTLVSIGYNEWFDFYRHAFSDLGGPRASNPWVYNVGLLIASFFVLLLSIDMMLVSRTRVGVVGASYLSVSAVFLAMIGIFPSGTYPHRFVSTWFFIQAFIGFLVYGLGEFRRDLGYLAGFIAVFMAGLLGALLVKWPSAAAIEAYEIILLTLASILYVAKHRFQNLTLHGQA